MTELKRIPIVIFTGAGASRAEPIALPTMFEFFQQIMDGERNPKSQRISNKEYFKFIFERIYGKDEDYDLERVMGALYQMTDFMQSDNWEILVHPSMYQNAAKKIVAHKSTSGHQSYHVSSCLNENDATKYISTSMKADWGRIKDNAAELLWNLEDLIREKYDYINFDSIRTVYAPFFDMMFELHKTKKDTATILPIFTTNYDMSVDWFFDPKVPKDRPPQTEWCNQRKVKLIDGFIKERWDKSEFGLIDESSKDTLYIPYHKLHGSLYWEKVEGEVRRSASVGRDYHGKQELMIVYPSDKKILSEDPYHFGHKMLDEYLIRCDNLLVIGFAFRDPAVVQAFQYALSYNKGLRIHIVNPTELSDLPNEARNFVAGNSDRISHVKEYFGTEQCLSELKKIRDDACE